MYSLLGGSAPAAGMTAPAGAQLGGGDPGMFASFMGGVDKYAKPASNIMSAASSAQQMMQQPQAQPQQTIGVMKPEDFAPVFEIMEKSFARTA